MILFVCNMTDSYIVHTHTHSYILKIGRETEKKDAVG